MTLPAKPLPTGTASVAGTDVPIRAMSRTEVVRFRSFEGNEDAAEPYVVARGTGVSDGEAAEWLNSVDVDTGGQLIRDILALTGLLDPQTGSTGEGPTAQP
jgi:hypothetical protein